MTALVVITLVVGWVLVSTIIGISACMVSSRVSQMEESAPVPRNLKPSYQISDPAPPSLPPDSVVDVAPAPTHN